MRDFNRKTRRFPIIALAVVLVTAGCSTTLESIPRTTSLEGAMTAVGRPAGRIEGEGDRHVVVIKDRHAVSKPFGYVRPAIRSVQRENRLLIEWLVDHGYGLLGCEYGLGPIVEDERTKPQFDFVRQKTRSRADLDRFRVYQPIRYQVQLAGRLRVHGVEDPDLYAQDETFFETLLKARRALKYGKIEDDATRENLLATIRDCLTGLERNTHPRGLAAGKNMVAVMEELGHEKAILMLGGAHVPAALVALEDAGVSATVFESEHYRDRRDADQD